MLKNKILSMHNYEVLRSKFRGCMLGALLGDCLGAPFEGEEITPGEKIVVRKYLDKLDEPGFKGPIKEYTDDTAMLISVAKFLIDKPEPDFKFLAKLFVKEYFSQPNRGYGQNVTKIFAKLKQSSFNDIYKPANEQFEGLGSFGNGGAMRIAPVALYYFDNPKFMIETAINATKITHTNCLGVNGAILQCLAVQEVFSVKHGDKLDALKFVKKLIEKMKPFEIQEEDDLEDLNEQPYKEKLLIIQNLLQRTYENDELYDEVLETLGNSISALHSVPTALYCFLKACSETADFKELFRKTIEYAICLGGDTDTIACMSGAITGAYVGEENLPQNMLKHCEKSNEILQIADNLLNSRQDISKN